MSIFTAATTGKRNQPAIPVEQNDQSIESLSPKRSIFQAANEYDDDEFDIPDEWKDEQQPLGAWDTYKDVQAQSIKEFGIGALGAPGDIINTLTGNWGEEKETPGQAQYAKTQNQIYGGESTPSFWDMFGEAMSSDDILPQIYRLPGQEGFRKANEAIGGPGEAKTDAGRYVGHGANVLGSIVSTGGANSLKNVAGAFAAGALSEAAKDAGFGPLGQLATEAITLMATGGRSAASKAQAKPLYKQMKALGYTDQDITIAMSAAKKDAKLLSQASKGEKTKKAIEHVAESSGKAANQVIKEAVPELSSGTKHIHELANAPYEKLFQEASQLKIPANKATSFNKTVNEVVADIGKSLGKNAEADPIVKRLRDAQSAINKGEATSENFFRLYSELGEAGNWSDPSKKERYLKALREATVDTVSSQGESGKQLATQFKEITTNKHKAFQIQKASDLIDKVNTLDGWDFNKLNTMFKKKENIKTLQEGLGREGAAKLYKIARISKDVKNFDKTFKGVSSGIKFHDAVNGGAAMLNLAHGNFKGLVGSLIFKGGEIAKNRLIEKMIVDPKYQDIQIRLLESLKNASPSTMARAKNDLEKALKEDGVDNYEL